MGADGGVHGPLGYELGSGGWGAETVGWAQVGRKMWGERGFSVVQGPWRHEWVRGEGSQGGQDLEEGQGPWGCVRGVWD